jgi:hypothetical protein
MGYETKLIIGKSTGVQWDEREKDKTKPYSDGSGFEDKVGKDGNPVLTGRKGTFFQVFMELDLCKMGSGPLSSLQSETVSRAKANGKQFFEFYGSTDGNHAVCEDRYGDPLWPVPLAEVLHALRQEDASYRRVKWAVALLEAMADEPEGVEVMFFGH